MTLRRPTLSALPALLLLTITARAPAIPYIPPYAQVINIPATIPSDGVVAVGMYPTFNSVSTNIVTDGVLDSVSSPDGSDIAGAASSFVVTLGDSGATQSIALWTPNAPLVEGSYIAMGLDEFGQPNQSGFAAVSPSGDVVPTPSISATLSSTQTPVNQVTCGVSYGLGAEIIPLYITTHYAQHPAVTFEFAFAAPDDVQSQFFSRVVEPGVSESQFLPAYFSEGVRSKGQLRVAAPQTSYCVQGELLSLQTQQIIATDVACVDDDGRDWGAVIPATSDQIDANLRTCNDPPPEYLPRYCALVEDTGVPHPVCDSLTPEQIDEGRDNPVEVGPLPDDPVINPPLDPIDPVDPPVDPGPAVPPVDPIAPDPNTPDPNDPADPNLNPEPSSPSSPVAVDPEDLDPNDEGPDETADPDGDGLDADGNPISNDEDVPDGDPDGSDQNLASTSASDTGNDGGCSVSAPNSNASWLSSLGFGLLLFGLGRARQSRLASQRAARASRSVEARASLTTAGPAIPALTRSR